MKWWSLSEKRSYTDQFSTHTTGHVKVTSICDIVHLRPKVRLDPTLYTKQFETQAKRLPGNPPVISDRGASRGRLRVEISNQWRLITTLLPRSQSVWPPPDRREKIGTQPPSSSYSCRRWTGQGSENGPDQIPGCTAVQNHGIWTHSLTVKARILGRRIHLTAGCLLTRITWVRSSATVCFAKLRAWSFFFRLISRILNHPTERSNYFLPPSCLPSGSAHTRPQLMVNLRLTSTLTSDVPVQLALAFGRLMGRYATTSARTAKVRFPIGLGYAPYLWSRYRLISVRYCGRTQHIVQPNGNLVILSAVFYEVI